MKTWKTLAFALVGTVLAVPSYAGATTEIIVNFRKDVTSVPSNPPGFQSTPMVSVGGDSHYGQPWEVMTASNGPLSCNDCYSEMQNFGGTGTVTFDQIPAIPAGEYHVYISFNISNWNGTSPVGFQLGGTGVTELGNEMPGQMHFFYPQANTGQDTKNDVEIAGPHMGPGSAHLWFGPASNQQPGNPVTLNAPDGTGTCAPLCPPIPTGSDPAGNNDTNSFGTSVMIDANNQFVLTIHDGADVDNLDPLDNPAGRPAYIRAYRVRFTPVPPGEACCLGDGTCQDVDPTACLALDGVSQGGGTTCAGTTCEQPQACCFFPEGTCSDLLAGACTSQGGTPEGSGTDCTTTSCPQPITEFTDVTVNDAGAICFPSATGVTYSLQYSNVVSTTGWMNAGASLTATETNSYLFDPSEPTGSDISNKVYRVLPQ